LAAIISRFAPAPTGFLHLGHVVSAIYVWGVTHSRHAGRVLLRIEDHDGQRSRRELETALLDDLEWLGFTPDEPMVRQSERGELYAAALDRLRTRGLVYACACTRSDLVAATRRPGPPGPGSPAVANLRDPMAGPEGPALQYRYPGTCRDRALPEAPGVGLRVRLEPSTERFVDERHGPLEQDPSKQCGDLLVRDREGNWTYQFAATVDDYAQGVTLVIRGDDLLESTGRQLQLARLLGRPEPPRFLHHPLIMKSAVQKLSKSDGDTGIRELRAKGWTPERVIGRAAARVGLVEPGTAIRADQVPGLFRTLKAER
jgi:glutamyl/glutaminyl-tRNA synthetase